MTKLQVTHKQRVKLLVTIAVTCALLSSAIPAFASWGLHINIAANMLWIWLE